MVTTAKLRHPAVRAKVAPARSQPNTRPQSARATPVQHGPGNTAKWTTPVGSVSKGSPRRLPWQPSGGTLHGDPSLGGSAPSTNATGATPKPNPTGYNVTVANTTLYNAAGKIIGKGGSGTYTASLVSIGGQSFYKFLRGGKTVYAKVSAKSLAGNVHPTYGSSAPKPGGAGGGIGTLPTGQGIDVPGGAVSGVGGGGPGNWASGDLLGLAGIPWVRAVEIIALIGAAYLLYTHVIGPRIHGKRRKGKR